MLAAAVDARERLLMEEDLPWLGSSASLTGGVHCPEVWRCRVASRLQVQIQTNANHHLRIGLAVVDNTKNR